ncbi:hypothetical protein CYY_008607 [Polysphondylium violaceum]|uniref:Biogenesis of lysosome-related organelles complex 1 subunit 2 n=1 Tax=Polysphondylium violaceum TaxID=133409 RepID=A0A8J4UQ26_9MYCE|nr:hypothetical protein CYY_008607 [Polysphondylium violaceum]
MSDKSNINNDTIQQKVNNDILKPNLPVTEDLQHMTGEMFTKVTNYLNGELSTTVADYNLLIQMNNVTAAKYQDMTNQTKGLSLFMSDLKSKYEEFQPYLDKISDLDKNVTDLEKTVLLLDEYTKRLETKIKNIDKSSLLPIKEKQQQIQQQQQQQQQEALKVQQQSSTSTTVADSTPVEKIEESK